MIWETHIGDTPIFHWTMIVGGRFYDLPRWPTVVFFLSLCFSDGLKWLDCFHFATKLQGFILTMSCWTPWGPLCRLCASPLRCRRMPFLVALAGRPWKLWRKSCRCMMGLETGEVEWRIVYIYNYMYTDHQTHQIKHKYNIELFIQIQRCRHNNTKNNDNNNNTNSSSHKTIHKGNANDDSSNNSDKNSNKSKHINSNSF